MINGRVQTPLGPLQGWIHRRTISSGLKLIGSEEKVADDEEKYNALIVDSGAIIKHTGFSRLHNTAKKYVTTQGVIDEIRDSKARNHLESLPFELEVREPTAEGLAKMVEFSKKTGDYASLSAVDMHILALLYDLEKEGCKTTEHIRTEPKRALTGRITALNKDAGTVNTTDVEEKSISETTPTESKPLLTGEDFFQGDIQVPLEQNKTEPIVEKKQGESSSNSNHAIPVKKSWATLVNPAAKSTAQNAIASTSPQPIATIAATTAFGSMTLGPMKATVTDEESSGGQFSDAEDDESLELPVNDCDSSDDDGAEYASIGDDFSDEDCDVYILDPEEVDDKKAKEEAGLSTGGNSVEAQNIRIEEELEMEFPSLSAAITVPYEGSDDEAENKDAGSADKLKKAEEEDLKRRQASLQPISKSGKLYPAFKGYKDIVSSSGVKIPPKKKERPSEEMEKTESFKKSTSVEEAPSKPKDVHSRVIGGTGFSGQSNEVDDDGEGWVTSTKEIASMKAMGTLDPFGGDSNRSQMMKIDENLPPKSDRAACATTDFAMQNVILQMNLELLSVDGVKVRKLKSWVTRCAACFMVYTGSDNDGKRIFCDRCGSSSLHRIAASIDGKTGRLKLHLKKNYKSKTRGTQFALPKPGNQNKYMGDLLLAEDQLLYGAWNQRVKMTKSKKEKQSIFGTDIAATVGCHQDLTKRGDIKIGFGRKNPNASKFGRERRGKKKKSSDKACGLRRY
jgi:RNA-binding protein NOB1